MEALPPELLCHIFQKLPPKEVYRLRRLNKATASFVDSHQTQLPKPTLSIAVGQAPEDKFVRKCGLITITTQKTTFRLVIDKMDNLSLLQVSDASKEFIMPFYDYVDQRAPATQKSLFFKWIFLKADIENFEIIPYENWLELAAWVSGGLKKAGAQCRNILMRHDYRLFNPHRPNTWIFFPQFCAQRKSLGTPLKLHVHPKVYTDAMVAPDHLDYLNIYCEWFSEVLCAFSFKLLYAPLYTIASRWVDQELDAINYRIRFDFNTVVPANVHVLGEAYKLKFIGLELFLDDVNNGDLDSFIGPDAFNRLPERIECNQNNGRGFLMFKFIKSEKFATLTVDYR